MQALSDSAQELSLQPQKTSLSSSNPDLNRMFCLFKLLTVENTATQ